MSESRVCTKCEKEKPTEEFGWHKVDGNSYVRSQCRECRRIVAKGYYKANKEKCIAASEKWSRENIEKVREAERARYWRNVDEARARVREKSMRSYEANPDRYQERIREINKRYREKHLEKIKADWKKWRSLYPPSYVRLLFRPRPGQQYPREILEVKQLQMRIKSLLKEKQQ